ncbi:MAG: 4-hydroxy-tetrahydrodipicolinate synthase [Rikenellaceae bacterium]
MNTFLNGVGVALVTPFTNSGAVDFEALKKLVDFTIAGGVDYLVALGTTAETATLTADEKDAVLDCVLATNAGRKSVVVGVGGNNTADVCAQLAKYSREGVNAILSVTPYYNKPSQEGIYQHYKQIATTSTLPVVLYNVPGRTGVNMTATTTLRLANEFSNIIAVKEASGNLGQVAYILRDRPANFKVISGDDNLSVALISQGGDGVISVAANSFPEVFSEMIHCALKGDYTTAQANLSRLLEATDLLFSEGNPTGVKAALAVKGILENNLRLPLVPSTEKLYASLKEQIEKYGI